MDGTGDSIGSEPDKDLFNTTVKSKPKKKSLVERELETTLTTKVTSPISVGEGTSTSRYGRSRRLKTDIDFCDTDKAITIALKSPKLQLTHMKVSSRVINTRRKTIAVCTPKTESPKSESTTHPNIEHQIKTIYSTNISLSRFNSDGKNDAQSPNKKTYVRKDLIQSKGKEETIALIKNMFSPTKSPYKNNSHLSNILERSSEKYDLTPIKVPKQANLKRRMSTSCPIQITNTTSERSEKMNHLKTKPKTPNLSKVSKQSTTKDNKTPNKLLKPNSLNYILQRLSEKSDLKITKSIGLRSRSTTLSQSPVRNTKSPNTTKLSKPQNLKTGRAKSAEKCTPNTKSPKILNTTVDSTEDYDQNATKTPKTVMSDNIIDLSMENDDDMSPTKLTPCTNASVVKILNFDNNKKDKLCEKVPVEKESSKNIQSELEENCAYQVGDLAWARMGTYPFWPCIVTREPGSELFVKKKLFGRIERDMLHVTFFGDNGRRSWIIDTMLRQFQGRLEFEAYRDKFTPEDKRKDPRFYAAFFISEKKKSLWSMSVDEAETLYKEPCDLRIVMLYEMLGKTTPKINTKRKSQCGVGRVTRINSDVSLSESLYDTLFSEDDGVNDDPERSRNKSRNKSLDVSEVVTACLDNMAVKTGITKIQRQSHMDIWLQKAKSKTPEKLDVTITVERIDDDCPEPKIIQPKELEKIAIKTQSKSKSNKKKKSGVAPVAVNVPYSFRKHVAESRNLLPFGYPSNEHDYSIKSDNIEKYPVSINEEVPPEGDNITTKIVIEQKPPKEGLQTEETVVQSSDECQSNSHKSYSGIMPVTEDTLDYVSPVIDDAIPIGFQAKLNDANNSKGDEELTDIDKESNIYNEVIMNENTNQLENLDELSQAPEVMVKDKDPVSLAFSTIVDSEEPITPSSPTYTQNFDYNDLTSSSIFEQTGDEQTGECNDLEREIESPTFTQTDPFELEDKINKIIPALDINEIISTNSFQNINIKKSIEGTKQECHLERSNTEAKEENYVYDHLVDFQNPITRKSENVARNHFSEKAGDPAHLETEKDKKAELNTKKAWNEMHVDSTDSESLNVSTALLNIDSTDSASLNVSSALVDAEIIECNDICNEIDELCAENDGNHGHELTPYTNSVKDPSYQGNHDAQKSVASDNAGNTDNIENETEELPAEPSGYTTNQSFKATLVKEAENLPLVATNGHATDEEIDVFAKKAANGENCEAEATALKSNNRQAKSIESIEIINEQPNYTRVIEINDVEIKLDNHEGDRIGYKKDSVELESTMHDLSENSIEKIQNGCYDKTISLVRCDMETQKKVLKIVCKRMTCNDICVINETKEDFAKENEHESDNDSMCSELDNVALSELKLITNSDAVSKISLQSDAATEIQSDDVIDIKSLKSDDLNDTSYVPSSDDISELSEIDINDLPSKPRNRRQTIDVRLFKQVPLKSGEDSSEALKINIDDLATRVKNRRRTVDASVHKQIKSGEDSSEALKINIDDLATRVKNRRRTVDSSVHKQIGVGSKKTEVASDYESLLDKPITTRIAHKNPAGPLKVNEPRERKEVSPECTDTEKDADTISIHSDDSASLLEKRKSKPKKESIHSKQDPEFLKYLELRQDTLVDEHPELNQEEIIAYLYKTWIYEESLKSDIKKSDDIEQSNLVKGTKQDTLPKKIKKRNKSRIINIDKLISKELMDSKPKPRRKAAAISYVDDLSDIEDEIEIFEIFKDKTLIDFTETTDNKVPVTSVNTNSIHAETGSTVPMKINTEKMSKVVNDKLPKLEGDNKAIKSETAVSQKSKAVEDEILDKVEQFFQQLLMPKPNVFKGQLREKVCEVCERTFDLVKCKSCNGMFHVKCATVTVEVEPPRVAVRGRKKKKPRPGRPKNSIESNLDENKSDVNGSEDLNMSVEENLQSITVNFDDFEEKAVVKMKEILEAETAYESYSSDDGHDCSEIVAGQCQIVTVKLKPRSKPIDTANFKCLNCEKYDTPLCSICKSDVSPKRQSMNVKVQTRQRCQFAHCNRYYHVDCLDPWPQTQFNSGGPSKRDKTTSELFEAFTCPRHVCHTCVCDDPRGCKTRFSGDKLARCVRCPATYHTFTKCLPAGTQILSASHIICPRHYENRPGKVPCHVNTGWCFICAEGGSLICCEYCPTSFHAECLQIKPPEGGYMCEDCETGRLPLYGEIMWVKLGHYRWWPGIVLHPCEIPDNIMAKRHFLGEFVVRFFGQYDHFWVNRGRVFPFQEGDSGRISSQKSKIDEAFTLAIEHAHKAFDILKSAAPNDEESSDIASSLLPPHYVKLKVNRPCGSLCGKKIDIEESSLNQCECNPNEEEPCGPYSQCLNRMLLTECGPICLAGDRCKNRDFEKRNYPKMVPYRTPYRGWGLKTLEPIRAGQFVIEYVGELIDEEEFRRRMTRQHEVRDENFYFLTLDKERMIDAGPKGNLARFMNHSCEPNCETQKWTVLGDVRVGLFAIKDIPANTEVNFNYNLECAGIEKKRCLCGAKRCSGYIGAKPKQEEIQPKKAKPVVQKRTYKKRIKTPSDQPSPSTSSNSIQSSTSELKRKRGRPRKVEKPRELTEIEKDLLIIKNATNDLSSDSEVSPTNLETEIKDDKSLQSERVSLSDDRVNDDLSSPRAKRFKLEDGSSEVGD